MERLKYIIFFHGIYDNMTHSDDARYQKCKKYYKAVDNYTLKTLGVNVKKFKDTHIHINDMRKSESIDDIRSICRNIGEDDIVVLSSLYDLAPTFSDAVESLEILYAKKIDIYITSMSIGVYDCYRDWILQQLALQKAQCSSARTAVTTKRIRKTKYDIELLQYASSLRQQHPQVNYADIEMYTGIPRNTLIAHIKRTLQELPKRETSRSITQEEISEIKKILKTSKGKK